MANDLAIAVNPRGMGCRPSFVLADMTTETGLVERQISSTEFVDADKLFIVCEHVPCGVNIDPGNVASNISLGQYPAVVSDLYRHR